MENMITFKGFPEGKVRLVPVPGTFFNELLPAIDHLGELKILLYTFWRMDRMEGTFRYLQRKDYIEDTTFMHGLGETTEEAQSALDEALERIVQRGVLLPAQMETEEGSLTYYFLNSPRGRAAVQAIVNGEWRPTTDQQVPATLDLEQPNIFRLYEEHIGPITPMLAESLKDAEQSYPAIWVRDAIRLAVENNKRSWRYIEAILSRWKEQGRDERKNRRDSEKARRRYADWEDN